MFRKVLGSLLAGLMMSTPAMAADNAGADGAAKVEAAVEAAAAVEAVDPNLEAAVNRVQKAYENLKTLSAQVVQTSRLSSLAKEERQKGSIILAKPGKMFWKFTEPREQLFISDGSKIYIYNQAEKQVIIQPLNPEGGVGVDFLLGLGNIRDQFDVKGVKEKEYQQEGRDALLLTPKKPSGSVSKLIFSVDGKTGLVQEVWTFDAMSNRTHLAFSQMELNGEVDDSLFAFAPPEGAEIIDASGGF